MTRNNLNKIVGVNTTSGDDLAVPRTVLKGNIEKANIFWGRLLKGLKFKIHEMKLEIQNLEVEVKRKQKENDALEKTNAELEGKWRDMKLTELRTANNYNCIFTVNKNQRKLTVTDQTTSEKYELEIEINPEQQDEERAIYFWEGQDRELKRVYLKETSSSLSPSLARFRCFS